MTEGLSTKSNDCTSHKRKDRENLDMDAFSTQTQRTQTHRRRPCGVENKDCSHQSLSHNPQNECQKHHTLEEAKKVFLPRTFGVSVDGFYTNTREYMSVTLSHKVCGTLLQKG